MQAFAGTSPVTFQIGKFSTVHRRNACNKALRNTFQQFAWQSSPQSHGPRTIISASDRRENAYRRTTGASQSVGADHLCGLDEPADL